MALTPEQLAEIQRLKALMQQPATDAQRKAQAVWNAEQMANKKAKGGQISQDVMQLAVMGKGGSMKDVEKHILDREGKYGLDRLQRALDEIPGLETMYSPDALRRAFSGDNAKALMTMDPAEFENFALPLEDRFTSEQSMRHTTGGDRIPFNEYIQHLAKIKGGFADVPFLEIDRRKPHYLPNISGHEGRHRSRAMASTGVKKSLVQLLPRANLREPLPRRHRDEFIEAMKSELRNRLVVPEAMHEKAMEQTRAGLPQRYEHLYISPEGKPTLPDIYANGGSVTHAHHLEIEERPL